jgi:hypothetical protein
VDRYLGSKGGSGVYQTIVNCLPPHDTYIEVCAGKATVLFKKAPALNNIILDLNHECIEYVSNKYEFKLDARIGCGIEFLEKFKPTDKTLIYIDPPYLESTRTSFNTSQYKFEFTFDDHIRLLKALKVLVKKYGDTVFCILSGYPSKLYDDSLKGWENLSFQGMTRGGVRTEKIWMSYQLDQIHFHTYAGKTANKRQDIKRKAESWARRFGAMEPAEKQAVFSALVCEMIKK